MLSLNICPSLAVYASAYVGGDDGNGVKCVSNAKDKCLNLKDIFIIVQLIN